MVWFVLGQRTSVKCAEAAWNYKVRGHSALEITCVFCFFLFFVFIFFCFYFFFYAECVAPQFFNFNGPDAKMDVIVALLAMGLSPNVCYHKEKRKLLTTENKSALIHKSSVNFSKFDQSFPSPFFAFAEKVSIDLSSFYYKKKPGILKNSQAKLHEFCFHKSHILKLYVQ